MITNKEDDCLSENVNDVSGNSIELKDVYDVFDRWLYLPDKKIIDILLAAALTREVRCGDHIFLFVVGASGDGKSELIRSFEDLVSVGKAMKLDQLTTKSIASGKKGARDIGSQINGKDILFLIPDLANLSSMNKDFKREIWAQFRTLYDGYCYKATGEDTTKKYDNINLTIIAGTTPIIYDEYIIHSQLGTRELLFKTDCNNRKEKSIRARDNKKSKSKMRSQLKNIVYRFLASKSFDMSINIPEEIRRFITYETEKLSILRATAQTDSRYYELINIVYPETPTRASIQFELLYQACKSLDKDYPDIRFKELIKHIVNSSGSQVRQDILNVFVNNPFEKYSIFELRNLLRLGRDCIKRELEILWNMKVLDKTHETEFIGRQEVVDDSGDIKYQKAGRIQNIDKYQFNEKSDNPLKGLN